MANQSSTRTQLAWGLSLGVHGLLALWLLFSALTMPDPPPTIEGVEVNFGTGDEGMGDVQPDEPGGASTADAPAENATEENVEQPADELAEEQPDAPAIATTPPVTPSKTVPNNPNPKTNPVSNPNNSSNPTTPTTPTIDPSALYPGKGKGKGGNEGETGKAGDQGSPDGSLYTKNREGGGSGGNSGGGNGSGKTGVIHTLRGRVMEKAPSIRYDKQLAGKVVVEVWVDEKGRVVRAIPGARGTTLSDHDIWEEVRQGILSSRFNAVPEMEDDQRGFITVTFVLQ